MIYEPPFMSSIMYCGPMLVVNIANHVKPLGRCHNRLHSCQLTMKYLYVLFTKQT